MIRYCRCDVLLQHFRTFSIWFHCVLGKLGNFYGFTKMLTDTLFHSPAKKFERIRNAVFTVFYSH
jgi:hypothetical protein